MKCKLTEEKKRIIIKTLNEKYQKLYGKDTKTKQENEECKTILKLLLKLQFNIA